MNLPPEVNGHLRLFLARRATDGEQPLRRLYWLHTRPVHPAWMLQVRADTVATWLAAAVPCEAPDGAKGDWRLATRFALVRVRSEPEAIGLHPSLLKGLVFLTVSES